LAVFFGGALISDLGFILTICGVAIAAVAGIIGVVRDLKTPVGWRVLLTSLILAGSIVTVSQDMLTRVQARNDRAASEAAQARQEAEHSRLERENASLRRRADETYKQATALNKQSIEILDRISQGLASTQEVETKTQVIADRARRIQAATGIALAQLGRLRTPLINISIAYNVEIPFRDNRLHSLRERLESIARAYGERIKNDESYWAGPVPLETLLGGLDQDDPTNTLLRSLDLQIEMYRPPFPTQPYFTNAKGNGGHSPARQVPGPDFWIATEWVSSLSQVLPVANFSTNTMPHLTPFSVSFIAKNNSVLRVIAGCSFLKTTSGRSGRLDSLADLAGSVVLIHLQPDIRLGSNFNLLANVRLQSLSLSIDNAMYTVQMHKLRTGVSPLFRWYELRIPVNADFRAYLTPV